MIILRMVKGRRCLGCSATRRVDSRTGLCSDCAGTAIEVSDRKVKLDETMRIRFARAGLKVSLVSPKHSQTPEWWIRSLHEVKAKLDELDKTKR